MADGLLYGSGDVVIGVDPASDHPDTLRTLLQQPDAIRARYDTPTRIVGG